MVVDVGSAGGDGGDESGDWTHISMTPLCHSAASSRMSSCSYSSARAAGPNVSVFDAPISALF